VLSVARPCGFTTLSSFAVPPCGSPCPGVPFVSLPCGSLLPGCPFVGPLARGPARGVLALVVLANAEFEVCQYVDHSVNVALSSSRGSFSAAWAALTSDRVRCLLSDLDLPLLGFQIPPLHRHTHGSSTPAPLHNKLRFVTSAGSRLVPSVFRPCRFSRLRRFPPFRGLRVCCIPQPIMGFTWFRVPSRQRRRSHHRRYPFDFAASPPSTPHRSVVLFVLLARRSPPGGCRLWLFP
jgi:hypothetical protein